MSNQIPGSYQQWIESGRSSSQITRSHMATKSKHQSATKRQSASFYSGLKNPMSRKADGDGTVSIETVSFIDAFCRRNLSPEEIMIVATFVETAMDYPSEPDRQYLRSLLRKTPQIVTASAARSSSEIADSIRSRPSSESPLRENREF